MAEVRRMLEGMRVEREEEERRERVQFEARNKALWDVSAVSSSCRSRTASTAVFISDYRH